MSADDWDNQMLYFVGNGYRVVAHDRRGHGRSSQVSDGHDGVAQVEVLDDGGDVGGSIRRSKGLFSTPST